MFVHNLHIIHAPDEKENVDTAWHYNIQSRQLLVADKRF